MDPTMLSLMLDNYFTDARENDQRVFEFFARTTENALAIQNANSSVLSLEASFPDQTRTQNDESSRDFYSRFMEKELQKFIKRQRERRNETPGDDFDSDESSSSGRQQIINDNMHINKTCPWERICILDYKVQLLQVIRDNRITIIKGFTGCGKSTQIPQYLAMDCQEQGRPCNIVVTQPRRVAAKMLATRVASELDCPVGSLVGYQIGLDQSKDLVKTRILYVTTGVLLQRFIMSSGLKHVTHIILDEVHERSAEMDMLFLAIKRKIYECKINVKIILMSATCNVDLFQEYFTLPEYSATTNSTVDIRPAVFEIQDSALGSTIRRFNQEIFYLEDIAKKFGNTIQLFYSESVKKYASYLDFLRQNNSKKMVFHKDFPRLHKDLQKAVLTILYEIEMANQLATYSRGAVLIFLPGMAEIQDLMDLLKECVFVARFKWEFYLLHSTVSLMDQTEVLKVSTNGSRRIILATNIAESSLTVPNVEFVIDFCLCKTQIACRKSYNMTYLALEWSSQSSLDQRAGRTGRTNHGQVFRLIPQHFYNTLEQFEMPEFERTPLENYVLKAKLIDDTLPPKNVLAYALSPPALEDIESSVLALKRMNALTVKTTTGTPQVLVKINTEEEIDFEGGEQRYLCDNGNLTSLGYFMALLPMDIVLSKLVALGVVFDCTYEAVIIAAAHCTSGFFKQSTIDPLRSYESHFKWADRSFSDSLAYLKAYLMYKRLEDSFKGVSAQAEKWCSKNEIDYHRLLEMETLVSEVINRLEMNIKISTRPDNDEVRQTTYPEQMQDLILKVIIAGAFYPNYFVRKYAQPDLLKKHQSSTFFNFKDTVIVSGLATDTTISTLYVPVLNELFKSCSPNIEYRVDGGTVYMKMDAESPGAASVDVDRFSDDGSGDPRQQLSSPSSSRRATSSRTSAGSGQSKRAVSSRYPSSCSETSVHDSVYMALATKKLKRPESINRFRPQIEEHHQIEIQKAIESILRSNANKQWTCCPGITPQTNTGNFTVKVCQNVRKYILPKTPRLASWLPGIAVHVTNVISPDMLFVLYKHFWVYQMFCNIHLLASKLSLGVVKSTGVPLLPSIPSLQKKSVCSVGDLVLAPLNPSRYRSLHYWNGFIDGSCTTIWARAEVVLLRTLQDKQMAFIFYIDFGLIELISVNCLHRLVCSDRFTVKEETRALIGEKELEEEIRRSGVQRVHDLLFSIAPLAVQCQLGRVKPPSNEGCWTPRVKAFLNEQCANKRFVFKAKFYEVKDGRPQVELFSLYEVEDKSPKVSILDILAGAEEKNKSKEMMMGLSLSEVLVNERLAELKLDAWSAKFCVDGIADWDCTLDNVELHFLDSFTNESREITLSLDSLKIENGGEVTYNVFNLRGPTSPLELTFRSLIRLNANRSCTVASSSINCVALEPDVDSARHARLLVAGEISLSGQRRDHLMLAHTTLMPNILDFPVLMAILWSPTVELRINRLLSERAYGLPEEICGALCGVGFDPQTGASYDPDADIELLFDSNVNTEDIERANLVRFHISKYFHIKFQHITHETPAGVRLQQSPSFEKLLGKRQKLCRLAVLQLLTRARLARYWFEKEPNQKSTGVRPTFRWNMINTSNQQRYRTFDFRPFNDALLASINLEKAVLTPIKIPILNVQTAAVTATATATASISTSSNITSNTSWEKSVQINLINLEADNLSFCQDQATGMYICMLCMFCTPKASEMQVHRLTDEHTEASRIFMSYYPIWETETAMMSNQVQATHEEERKEAQRAQLNSPRADHNAWEVHGYDRLSSHLSESHDLKKQTINGGGSCSNSASLAVIPFNGLSNVGQRDDPLYIDDPYFLTPETPENSPPIAEDSANSAFLIDFDDVPTSETSSTVNELTAAIDDLHDYFSENQVARLLRAKLLSDFE